MKEDPQLKDIPVFILSANNELQSVAQCIEKGAVNYFIKPVHVKVSIEIP